MNGSKTISHIIRENKHKKAMNRHFCRMRFVKFILNIYHMHVPKAEVRVNYIRINISNLHMTCHSLKN